MRAVRIALAAGSIAAAGCPESREVARAASDQPEAGSAPIVDAGPPPPEASVKARIVLGPRHGEAADDTTKPAGPGVILSSSDLAAGFRWARDQIGGAGRAGDVVVLSAIEADGLALSIYDAAPFRSAQNVVLPKDASPADAEVAAAIVAKAELVWVAGGDQSTYVTPWRGTALPAAISAVWTRGGVVGGASAGTLVLGEFVYDATVTGVSETVTPEVALADPFDPRISFTRKMISLPPLAGAITEVHFEARSRMGRIVSFMARQQADGAVERMPREVLGVAVSDGAAIAIDRDGIGALLRDGGSARAFVIRGGVPTTAAPGQRLAYPGLRVHRLDDASQRFDFTRWCGTTPSFLVDVSPSETTPFGDTSPYDRPGTTSPCP